MPVAVSQILTDREQVKTIVTSGDSYKGLRGALLSNTEPTDTAGELSAENEALRKIFDKYLDKNNFNRIAGGIVDSTYDWLEGKTDQPKFNIAFASNEAEFKAFITTVFTERFNSLPLCEGSVDLTSYNPLEASCRPEGYTAETVTQFINDQAASPELSGFYHNASINSDLVFGQLDTSTTDALRGYYNILKFIPIIFLIAFIALSALIFLIVKNWRKSLKIFALTTLISTAVTYGTSFIFIYVVKGYAASQSKEGLGLTLDYFIQQILLRFNIYAAILTAISVIALLALHFAKPKVTSVDTMAPNTNEPISKEQKP